MPLQPPSPSPRRDFLRQLAGTATMAGLVGPGLYAARAASGPPLATTRSGRIAGFVERGIHVFRGVPYGGDTARRRFQRAVREAAWTGTRDATRFGASPPPARRCRRTGRQRGLPVPQRLYACPARRRQASGPVLHPRRRLQQRLRFACPLRRREPVPPRRCRRGHRQPPAQRVRLPVSRRERRRTPARRRKRRPAGPDRRPALGARACARVRRRRGQRHRVRPVRRGCQDRHAHGHAGGRWPVPQGDDDERPAGHRGRPARRRAAHCAVSRRTGAGPARHRRAAGNADGAPAGGDARA